MKTIYKKVKFFYNNLGIYREIICFTVSLFIKKNEKFLHESYSSVQYFFFFVKVLALCLIKYLL